MKDSLDGDRKENLKGGSKFSEVAVVTGQEVVKQPCFLHPSPVLCLLIFIEFFPSEFWQK